MGVTIVPNQKGVDELTMDQMLGKTGSKSSKKKKKIEEVLKDLGIPTVKEGSRTMSSLHLLLKKNKRKTRQIEKKIKKLRLRRRSILKKNIETKKN